VRHAGSGARRRASAREGGGARRALPREEHPVRLQAEGHRADDGQLLHAGHEARRPLPLSVPACSRVVLRQGVLLPVHPRGSGRPDAAVARGDLERREVRGDAPPPARTRDLPGVPAVLQGGALTAAGRRHGRSAEAARDSADAGAQLMSSPQRLGRRTLLVNPPLVNGIAFTRQGRCQEREEVLGTTKPPYTLGLIAALLRDAGCDVRLVDLTAERRTAHDLVARLERESFTPTLILFPSTTPTLGVDVEAMATLKARFGAPMFCFGPHASTTPAASMQRAPAVDGMFVGEPEDAAVQLARLESLADLGAIPSLTWRRNPSMGLGAGPSTGLGAGGMIVP